MSDTIYSFGIETEYKGVAEATQAVEKLRKQIDNASKLEVKVDERELKNAKKHLTALEKAIDETKRSGGDFSSTFNKELKKVQTETKSTGKSIKDVQKNVKSLETTSRGGSGFGAISKSAKIATRDIRETDTQLDKLKTNLQQGIGQTVAFAGIGAITAGAGKMLSDVAKLDDIMMNISIVSGKSADEMDRYRNSAGQTADILGTLGSKYLEASLIYEQQGGEAAYYAKELAEATVVAANISQESTGQMSEYLTATINGFQLLKEKGGDAGMYITDVMAKLGAASGSDLSEIATGLTRTANTAKDVGFEFEEISTMIATVSEVTRRTPETIGNAFKSMLTSFTQLREGSEEEVNEFTNKIENAFQLAGIKDISVFDNGNLRDASDIFKDIGNKWEDMSVEGQALVSEAVAGKYQAEVFRAFMNNQERYNTLLGEAYESGGTAAMQQIVYMDSLEAKIAQMGNAWEQVSSAIVDTDLYKGLIEQFTTMFKLVGNSESSLTAIAKLASPLAGIFSTTIGKGLGGAIGDKAFGSITSYKNLEKELSLSKEITEAEKKRKLEEYKIGEKQRELKDSMSASDAAYYESNLQAQEKLNEKIGQQNELLEKVKTEKGKAEIREDLDTKGGTKGMAIRDYDEKKKRALIEIQDKYNDELEKSKKLLAESEKLSKRKVELEAKADRTSLESALKNVKYLDEEIVGSNKLNNLKIEKGKIEREIKRTGENDTKQLEKTKEKIETLNKKILKEEKEIAENLKRQSKETEESYQNKVKADVKKASEDIITDEVGKIQGENRSDIVELETLKAQSRITEDVTKKKQVLQGAIRGLMSGYSAIVPTISAFNGVMDGTITQSEGVVTSLNSISLALMTSGNPIAMVGGMVVETLTQFGDYTGAFKTEAEKTIETNESLIRSFMSLEESAGQKVGLLKDVKEQYAELQGVSPEELFSPLEVGASEEAIREHNAQQTQYLELSNKVAESAPELIKYYDAQGNAIVDLSQDYDELLKMKEEEQRLNSELMSDNMDSFASQIFDTYSKGKDEIEEYKDKLVELNKQKNKLMEDGKDPAKVIGEIAEMNEKIAASSASMTKAGGNIQAQIVQPWFKGSEALDNLRRSNESLFNQMSEFAGQYMNQKNIMEMFKSNSEENLTKVKANMEMIADQANRLEQAEEGKGSKWLDEFMEKYDTKTRLLLESEDFKNVNEMTEALDNQSFAFKTLIGETEGFANAIREKKAIQEGDTRTLADSQEEVSKLTEEYEKLGGEAVETHSAMEHAIGNDTLDIGLKSATSNAIETKKEISELKDEMKEMSMVTPELEDQLSQISGAFRESSSSAEGFNENLKDLQNFADVEDMYKTFVEQASELDPGEQLSSLGEVYETLNTLMPEAIANIEELREQGGNLFDEMDIQIEAMDMKQGAMLAGMMESDNNVFIQWAEQNKEKLELIEERYNVELENVQSVQELDANLMEASLENRQGIYDIMNANEEEFNQKQIEARKQTESEIELGAEILGNKLGTINLETNEDVLKNDEDTVKNRKEVLGGVTEIFEDQNKVLGEVFEKSQKEQNKSVKKSAEENKKEVLTQKKDEVDKLVSAEGEIYIQTRVRQAEVRKDATKTANHMLEQINKVRKAFKMSAVEIDKDTSESVEKLTERLKKDEAARTAAVKSKTKDTVSSFTKGILGAGTSADGMDFSKGLSSKKTAEDYANEGRAKREKEAAERKEKEDRERAQRAADAAEKQAKKDAEKAAKEAEKERKKKEKEAEKARKKAEKEAEKARKKKEKDAEKARKAKEAKDKKERSVENIKLELNAYVKLENQLKQVTDAMGELATQKGMAYGQDKIKLMEKEQKLLKQQSDLSSKYAKQLESEQARLRSKLSGKGFAFSGVDLTNQNENLKARENAVNAIKKNADKKEAAKKALTALQKDVDRYNEVTYSLIPDKKKAKLEAKKMASDIAKEKIEYNVKLKVDKTDLKRSVLDVVAEFKDGFDNLDERMQLSQKKTETYLSDISTYQQQLRDVQSNTSLSQNEKEEMSKSIKGQILGAVSSAKGAYKEIEELQKQFTSEAIGAINQVASNYDRIISKAQEMMEIQKDLYGARNQKEINKYYDIQENAIEGSINSQQKVMNQLIKYKESLKEGSESWKETNNAINKIADDIENKLMQKMDLLKSKWDDTVDGMLQKVDESFGTWGLDGAKDQFDKLTEAQETYFSSFDKLNTIGGKIAEINKQIANTTDPAQAKVLADFRDQELKNLMAQDQVSKAEYERAMKLFDIKQKEAAMSERENAQRVAQLVRDESGNMTYEYVRGETPEVSKDYEDLQKMKDELMEFDESQVKAAGSKIFEIIANYQNKVKELSDKGLSTDDYQRELNKLLAQAQTDMDAQQSIIDKWMDNLGTDGIDKLQDLMTSGVLDSEELGLNTEQLDKFFAALQNKTIEMKDLMKGDSSGLVEALGISEKQADEMMSKVVTLVTGKNKEIVDQLKEASNTWTNTAQSNVNTLGKEYEKYMTVAEKTLSRYNKTTGELNKLLKDTNANSKQVIEVIDKQTSAMNRTTGATNKTSRSINNLEKMLIGNGKSGLFGSMVQLKNEMNGRLQPSLQHTERDTYKVRDASRDASKKMNVFAKESDNAYKKTKQFAGQPIKEANNEITIMGNKSRIVYQNFEKMGFNADIARRKIGDLKSALAALPGSENIARSTESERSRGRATSMATGGYTGTWSGSTGNQEGRMAILHEKELVLNKDDTRNILEAVNMQRKLMANIGNREAGTRSIINNQSQTNKIINSNTSSERIISSNPVINATFPDVRNSNEIEKAFGGLLAKASTFISK